MTTTPPAFSDANAIKMAACHFGIHAEVQRLVSERDQNFRLDAKDGKRYTLKISNEAEQEVVIDFQNRALLRVAEKDPSFPLPRVIPTLDGQLHCIVEDGGKTHFVLLPEKTHTQYLHEAVLIPVRRRFVIPVFQKPIKQLTRAFSAVPRK